MPPTTVGIGDKLREAREERALSVEETAWRTRIRPEVLRALEDEDFAALGHAAFVRSHLFSYARFLGIDAAEIVEAFERMWGEDLPSPIEELEKRRREAKRPPRPKWAIAAALSAALLAAAATIGVLGGQAERPGPDRALPPLTEPPASAVEPVSPASARVRLRVAATAPTTVTVLVDGAERYEGPLDPERPRTFRARGTIEIVASDGGAVRVAHNGSKPAALGEPGEVARARFGPIGRIDD